MSFMFNKDLLERVAATFGQAAVGAIGTNSVLDLGVDNWKMVLSAGVAAALSVLKGAFAAKMGTKGTASLVD
jgi:hypothetical protein|tara:strand:+ start:1316 stop:1531 length:216 start_codon:yes stop_codon:yes gene_type:complete